MSSTALSSNTHPNGALLPVGDSGTTPPRAFGKMVVGSVLATAARRFRDRESYFCVGTGRRFTFRQSNERCNRLASGLSGLGLRKSDVVAFLCNNRAEMVEIYFALAKTGMVGVPINYRLAPPEIVALTQAMDAHAFLFHTRFAAAAEQVHTALPTLSNYVAIGEGRPDWALGYEELLAGASPAEPEVEVEEDDPFYFNLTSGTTGLPKSYVITHYNMATGGPGFWEAFDMTSRDVIMTVFPAFGRVGFAWLLATAALGARNVLADFNPSEALHLIETERVTLVNLVPTMAAMMLVEPNLSRCDLRSLRAIVFVGAMFPAPLRKRVAAEISPAIWEYYGMQETSILTLSVPEDRTIRPESVGLPVCFAEVKITRPDGNRAAPQELGEILGICSPRPSERVARSFG